MESKSHVRGKKRKMRLHLVRNREAIQRKVKQLKRLIPRGHEMENAETLYQKTANYISLLQWQVSVLENVTALYAARIPKQSSLSPTKDTK
ncbi:Transcription factor bHLH87 like [Actinidia chinensis var. chinensis]|uniref:Transcription factor bHLH87 like n=1 Tax=Actinidia chinensis var. chinensis TaxID=1590841 RepID=A0A2R6Q8T6_ACTCC|nr:Transcription factor bHLH87 like [Actinidia chinensis var. chinensis]